MTSSSVFLHNITRMMSTKVIFAVALVACVALSVEAEPEVSDKVFFDIEMGGKPAGTYIIIAHAQ